METTRQIESKMKSARGVEYSKPTYGIVRKLEVKVGIESPGVELNQRVFLSFPVQDFDGSLVNV